MKKSLFQSLFLFLLAPALLLAFTPKPDRANFSGEWKLNAGKSELGQFADFAVRVIKAEQKSDQISISRTSASFEGGDMTVTETLTFDGKEAESPIWGSSKKKATGKWSDDGKSFNIKYTLYLDFNGETSEITGTETWTLTDNGKTLVSQNSSTSSFGDMTTRSVYEKQ